MSIGNFQNYIVIAIIVHNFQAVLVPQGECNITC